MKKNSLFYTSFFRFKGFEGTRGEQGKDEVDHGNILLKKSLN
jgi:hypothetical protein